MNLDEQTIRTSGHRRFGHRRDEIPLARGMAGVDDDRKMRQLFQCRNSCEIQRVPILGFKGTNASLAQHDVLVSA